MNGYMKNVRHALEEAGIIRPSRASGLASFALGTGIGLLAGATVALLLTPHSGPEMRRQLGTKAKEMANRTTVLVEKAKGTVSRLEAEAKDVKHGRNDIPISG